MNRYRRKRNIVANRCVTLRRKYCSGREGSGNDEPKLHEHRSGAHYKRKLQKCKRNIGASLLHSIGFEIEVELAHILDLEFLSVAARDLDGIQVFRCDVAGDIAPVEA
jgi:hypothetical protein